MCPLLFAIRRKKYELFQITVLRPLLVLKIDGALTPDPQTEPERTKFSRLLVAQVGDSTVLLGGLSASSGDLAFEELLASVVRRSSAFIGGSSAP